MKLRELLNALKNHISPNPQTDYNAILAEVTSEHADKKGNLTRLLIGVCGALLLIGGLGFYTYRYYTFDPSVNITGDTAALSPIVYVEADKKDAFGVHTKTDITVVTKESISAKELSEYISISPAVPFDIVKKSTNRFRLKLSEKLEENTAYTVNATVSDTILYRWSLQTKTPFAIESVSPAKSETGVNCDSAVHITFSESNVGAIDEYFSIYPEVSGSFSHKGRVWSFIPEKSLAPCTTYTVTLTGDIHGVENKAIGEDYSFSFTTGKNDDRYAQIVTNTYDPAPIFSTTKAPFFTISAGGMSTLTADITLYKIADASLYQSLHQKYYQTNVLSLAVLKDVTDSGAQLHSRFSVSAVPDPQEKGIYYFSLPKELEAGYYLMEIIWNNTKCYQLMQSSDLTAYTALEQDKLTVWVNNVQTKASESDATVILGKQSTKTNHQGIAEITAESPVGEHQYLTVSTKKLSPLVIAVAPTTERALAKDYTVTLFPARDVLPTDSFSLDGVVQKYFQYAADPTLTILDKQQNKEFDVTQKADGYFSLPLEFNNAEPGEYHYVLLINDVVVEKWKFNVVASNTHPTLTVSSDKNAYFSGENALLTVNALKANRLPAASLTLNNGISSATTDAAGNATMTFPLSYSKGKKFSPLSTCGPVLFNVTVSGKDISTKKPFIIFDTNEYLSATVLAQTENNCSLEVRTNKVDLTSLNALDGIAFSAKCDNLSPADYLGAAVDKDITVEIHDVSFSRKQSGTFFDPKSNKIQLKYKYTEQDKIVKTVKIKTTGGVASVGDFPLPTASGYRYLKFIMKDSAGKECAQTVYIDSKINSDAVSYAFKAPESVATGEKFVLSVYDPSGKTKLSGGHFLYHIQSADNTLTAMISGTNGSVEFKESFGNTATVSGVYFNGENYFHLPTEALSVTENSKNLQVTLSPNSPTLATGEKAEYSATVTDADGKPVANAALYLTLSDAGSPLSLKNLKETNRAQNICTNLPQNNEESAEESETENGERVLLSLHATTNHNGQATFKVELPQQSGVYALTLQAFSGENYGYIRTSQSLKKDYELISALSNEKQIDKDIILSFAVTGNKITADAAAVSTLTLTAADESILPVIVPITHSVGEQTHNFGKLKKGDYTLEISSAIGSETVTSTQQFTVTDRYAERKPVDSPAEMYTDDILIFADSRNTVLLENLKTLYTVEGDTLGAKLSKLYAASILKDTSATLSIQNILKEHTVLDGYAENISDEKPNLLVSAAVASLFPNAVNADDLDRYFSSVLLDKESTLEDILAVLWGKAALGQTVERDLDFYFGEGNGMSTEQYLLFALGYAYSGNQTKANTIYAERLKTKLTQTAEGITISDEATPDVPLCELLSLFSARISSKDTADIAAYALEKGGDSALCDFIKTSVVKEYIPALQGVNEVEIGIHDVGSETITFPACSFKAFRTGGNISNTGIIQKKGNSTLLAMTSTQIPEPPATPIAPLPSEENAPLPEENTEL